MKDYVRDFIRFIMVCIIISLLLYFFYPIIRYEYKNSGESNLLYRIDRFTGEVYRLTSARGWVGVFENE